MAGPGGHLPPGGCRLQAEAGAAIHVEDEKAAELKKKFQTMDASLELRNGSLVKDVAEIRVTQSARVSGGRNSFDKSLDRGHRSFVARSR